LYCNKTTTQQPDCFRKVYLYWSSNKLWESWPTSKIPTFYITCLTLQLNIG